MAQSTTTESTHTPVPTTSAPVTSDELHEETVVAGEAGHEAPSGLAVLGVDTPFLLAQVINFLILFVVLRWVLYRPILDVLKKRRTTIQESLKHAEKAKQEAESAEQQTSALLAKARTEAKQIVDDAKAQASQAAEEMKSQAANESEALLERTRAQLAQEKSAVLANAENELGDLVLRAAQKVVANQESTIDPASVADAVKLAKEGR